MAESAPWWLERARAEAERVAVVDARGEHRYGELIESSEQLARRWLAEHGRSLAGERIAFLVEPDVDWPRTLWAIWRLGALAVPLSPLHPEPELERLIVDADPALLVASPPLVERLASIARRQRRPLRTSEVGAADAGTGEALPPPAAADDPALIVYTSGSTGDPKGVVLAQLALRAQVDTLIEAWGWRRDDRALLVLPLHHVHGIVNVLLCALGRGASCEMRSGFEAEATWERLASGEISVFMAVPTIYRRLIGRWEEAPEETRRRWAEGARRLRLMVSGSAALPESVLERWQEITGHRLLERYGMTETGMILSNPLDGERRAGTVGRPLPGVEVRFRDGGELLEGAVTGELAVRGPGLFTGYWRRPEATREAFEDGWFVTGDVARRDEEGVYRLLGRRSVDILKSSGYKISALEVEEVLRRHPAVGECAVVGVADADRGEAICAAIEALAGGEAPDPEELRRWCRERLAAYKTPRRWRVVEGLPRNAMGKVVKPEVRRWFEESGD